MLCFEDAQIAVDNASGEQTLSPEDKLMLVEDALMTLRVGLRSTSPKLRRRCCEIERWISSRESDATFSFERICTTLGLDPAYIRLVLKQLKRHAIGEPPRANPVRRGRVTVRQHAGQFSVTP